MGKPDRQHLQLGLILVCAAAGLILLLVGAFSDHGPEATATVAADWQAYTAALEAKAAELCTRVDGVEDVTVAVSLAQGVEYVYDEKQLLTERPPQISGIGVVCAGGNDPVTVQTIVSLLSAAFGVGSNRIYVTAAG